MKGHLYFFPAHVNSFSEAAMSVSKESIYHARNVDLYTFLTRYHSSEIDHEGKKYIRLKEHHSIVIEQGHSHYVRYSEKDETGNPIDLLVRYLGYGFEEAVIALNTSLTEAPPRMVMASVPSCDRKIDCEDLIFPPIGEQPFRRVYSYLTLTRMIAPEAVNWLIRAGLLYQDKQYGNAVFINRERSYAEIRGTLSNVRYHRCIRSAGDVSYWYFKAGGRNSSVAFICEGAIDAISLYELQRRRWKMDVPAIYCSMGGVGNQRVIEAIEHVGFSKVILAVDNDSAGEKCRLMNRHLGCMIPEGKDWNETLKSWKSRNQRWL